MNRKTTVLYASQMGAAAELGGRAADDLTEAGIETTDVDLSDYNLENLKSEQDVLIIASTWGEGEPPDDCLDFYEALTSQDPLGLSDLRFATFALGDSSYEHFCKHGKDLDEHFERHGGRRMIERVDCDMDEQEQYPIWIEKVIKILKSNVLQEA
ncbi:MAG: flavodoxin domain-containing protein [Verrucomicrobiota bacterium]